MCGKDGNTLAESCYEQGSPPHVREGRYVEALGVDGAGITPACAGRTGLIGYVGVYKWDHPCSRGKDSE